MRNSKLFKRLQPVTMIVIAIGLGLTVTALIGAIVLTAVVVMIFAGLERVLDAVTTEALDCREYVEGLEKAVLWSRRRLDRLVEELEAAKPKAAKPKAEQPRAEQPRAEQPRAEQPRAEQPSAEQPSAEQPSAEQPRAEQPMWTDRKADTSDQVTTEWSIEQPIWAEVSELSALTDSGEDDELRPLS